MKKVWKKKLSRTIPPMTRGIGIYDNDKEHSFEYEDVSLEAYVIKLYTFFYIKDISNSLHCLHTSTTTKDIRMKKYFN